MTTWPTTKLQIAVQMQKYLNNFISEIGVNIFAKIQFATLKLSLNLEKHPETRILDNLLAFTFKTG